MNSLINMLIIYQIIYQRRKRLLHFRLFNIDSLKYDIHSPTNEFLGYLSSSMILLYIPHPTTVPGHSKSLIDKIDNILKRSYLWKFNIYISDHFSQFLIMPSIFSDTSSHKSNVYEKHQSNFNKEEFISDNFQKDRNLRKNDVNYSSDNFPLNINKRCLRGSKILH